MVTLAATAGVAWDEHVLHRCRSLLAHEVTQQPWSGRAGRSKNKTRKNEHKWRTYLADFVHLLRQAILAVVETIPSHAALSGAWGDLYAELCECTREGQCVAFDTSLKRTAYMLYCLKKRSQYMANVFALVETGYPAVIELFDQSSSAPIIVSSFGGGPGFSAAGFLAFLFFNLATRKRHVEWHVLDYEQGWSEQCRIMETALRAVRKALLVETLPTIDIKFASCDVRYSIYDEAGLNSAVPGIARRAEMFVFSFVLVENELALRETKFQFLAELYSASKRAVTNHFLASVFMDSTHRLWPEIVRVLEQHMPNLGYVPKITCMKKDLPTNAMLALHPNSDPRLASPDICSYGFSILAHDKRNMLSRYELDCNAQTSFRKVRDENEIAEDIEVGQLLNEGSL